MKRGTFLAALFACGCLAGGEGDELPGGGTLSGSLSGTWALPAETWLLFQDQVSGATPVCELRFSGSSGSADCEATGEIETWDYDEETGEEEWVTLDVKTRLQSAVTIQETLVSAEGTYTQRFTGRGYDRTCTLSFRGSASRKEGRASEGRFQVFAGLWDGSVNVDLSCVDESDRGDYTESMGWRFTADLFAEQGTVTVTRSDGSDTTTWLILNTPVGLRVNTESGDPLVARELE